MLKKQFQKDYETTKTVKLGENLAYLESNIKRLNERISEIHKTLR